MQHYYVEISIVWLYQQDHKAGLTGMTKSKKNITTRKLTDKDMETAMGLLTPVIAQLEEQHHIPKMLVFEILLNLSSSSICSATGIEPFRKNFNDHLDRLKPEFERCSPDLS